MTFLAAENAFPNFKRLFLIASLFLVPSVALADVETDYKSGVSAFRAGDIVGAMPPLKRAADQGYAPAQALYGYLLDTAELDAEAGDYLKRAVEAKDFDGMYYLARMYLSGEATPTDPGEPGRLYREAARAGHEGSIIVLATAYLNGDERLAAADPKNPEALEYLTKAAEAGNAGAITALIDAYSVQGKFNITPDLAKAAFWSERLKKAQATTQTGAKK